MARILREEFFLFFLVKVGEKTEAKGKESPEMAEVPEVTWMSEMAKMAKMTDPPAEPRWVIHLFAAVRTRVVTGEIEFTPAARTHLNDTVTTVFVHLVGIGINAYAAPPALRFTLRFT